MMDESVKRLLMKKGGRSKKGVVHKKILVEVANILKCREKKNRNKRRLTSNYYCLLQLLKKKAKKKLSRKISHPDKVI